MRTNTMRMAGVATLAALALAGCGSAHPLVPEASPSDSAVSQAPPTEDVPTEDTPTTVSTGKCDVGSHVTLGDWTVTFVKIDRNANRLIARANEFNDKPKVQYVLVTYKATYLGSDRTADVDVDLTWTLTPTDNVVVDASSEVTPYSDKSTTARKGGTVNAQVLFDANPKDAILAVETLVAGDYAECNL